MAYSNKNVVVHNLSGKVGDLLVFRQRHGKTFVSKIPRSAGEPSEAQIKNREQFRKATSYAKSSMAIPERKTAYERKAASGVTAYNLALADYFGAPKVQAIDAGLYDGTIGSQLHIEATDNFQVQSVEVSILAPDGTMLEKGQALRQEGTDSWTYVATTFNDSLMGSTIEVQAVDIPGNRTTVQKKLE